MNPERQPIEYTDESPLDIDSPRWDSLAHVIMKRCEAATADLGSFGIGMGGRSSDGTISIYFGPNMLVRWDQVVGALTPVKSRRVET